MEPSNHTKLMNFIIGMCKKHRDWITVLSDFGFNPEVLEQRIRTASGDAVKPDVIATSNRLIYTLVFDCKGGITVDQDQMRRYSSLATSDILRWTSPFTDQNYHFDVCISDLEENHSAIIPTTNGFPIITFGRESIFKTRDFSDRQLNSAFENPISLSEKQSQRFFFCIILKKRGLICICRINKGADIALNVERKSQEVINLVIAGLVGDVLFFTLLAVQLVSGYEQKKFDFRTKI